MSNKVTKRLTRGVTITSLLFSFSGMVHAQGTTVNILGRIHDQSQALLPGVTVTATGKDTGQTRTAVSDDQGRYILAQMRVGSYTLQAELPGFQTALREVTLTLEADTVVNFTLAVGGATTEITVTSEAPMIETTSSSVSSLVSHQQIRDLPLIARSFTDLTTLQTGVIVNYTGGSPLATQGQMGNEGVKISMSGSRTTQVLFQLDGTDIRNFRASTPGSLAGVLLGVDTVQEFSVITNAPNAEYGHFLGGVVNAVTKSGTNEFHGSLFEFLRNSALDARNFFDRDPKNPQQRSSPPPFRRNQYGGILGGAIQKDKLFFFASVEALNDRLTTTQTDVVPSLDARSGSIPNQGQFPVSPISKPILDAYPLPNGPVRPDGTADYLFGARRVTDEVYVMGKIDWYVNDKDTIAGRYVRDNAERFRPFSMVVDEEARSRNQYVLLEWRRVLSQNFINEARVSLNRTLNANEPVGLSSLPPVMHFNPQAFTYSKGEPLPGLISVPSLSTLGFTDLLYQPAFVQNRFQYIDNLAYSTGAHSLKAGLNIHRLQFNSAFPVFMAGNYTFVSLRDLITAATPRTYFGTISGIVPRGMRQFLMGFYVQDDWRVRPTLTVNLGLRYEPITLPREVAARLSTFRRPTDTSLTVGNPLFAVNPSLKNFGPRIGVAWDPFGDAKTSIRFGYGLFFDLVNPVYYYNSIHTNPPFVTTLTLNRPSFPDIRAGLPADLSGIRVSPYGFSDEIEQGGLHQYQLSVQRQLSADLMVQFSYMGSRGYNLVHLLDRNTALPQRDAEGRYPYYPAGSPRRNSAFNRMRDYAWDGSSFYNALGITVKKRFTQGYSLQASYTFGKAIDDAATGSTSEDSGGQPVGLSTFTDDITFDHALSVVDVRNRISINGSWDIPFGSGRTIGGDWRGPIQQILGGWSLNGILTASDGNWQSVRIPFNWSRSAQTADVPDRPSLIPGGNQNPVLADGRDPNRYFDDTQFLLGPPGYFGTLGRNTLERPGVFTLDFSLQKNFNFSEQRYLQFRAEMFNITNRANFASPNSTVILDETGRRSLTAGRITNTNTTSRQVQFGLKIYF
ncbi:MAG: TonB-dependent receptor [Acidobacteria bacterium]|nr:TonB-dependent receptor [Acidobacteriota bacterium]